MSIEVILPPALAPQSEHCELVDDTTAMFRPTQAPGLSQRVSFSEPRLQVRQGFKSLRLYERAAMLSTLRRVQGKYGTLRALCGYNFRGSFPATEAIVNGTFTAAATSPWTVNQTALAINDLKMRVAAANSTAANWGAYQGPLAVTSGAAYVARVCQYAGRNTSAESSGLYVGNAGMAATYLSALSASDGLVKGIFIASVSSVYFSLVNATTGQASDAFDVAWASLSRCAQVDSGQWTSNFMNVKSLPSSTSGLLLNDDLFCINGELKACIAQLDSDGSGKGFLQFSPGMFRAPATGDALEIFRPAAKFVLAGNVAWDNQFGQYADVDLTFEAVNE